MEHLLETIAELNYEIVSNDGQYIKAVSIHKWDTVNDKPISCKGKRILYINQDKDYCYAQIKEDGDTRTVFNGFIESADDLKLINKLTLIL